MEPWTLENGVLSGEIGIFPTNFSLVRAQPYLYFPYVSIMAPFLVTSNDTEQEWSMLFTSESKTSKQRCTYGHPNFCGFGLEHAVPIHPNFEPCSLNAKVARWSNEHN